VNWEYNGYGEKWPAYFEDRKQFIDWYNIKSHPHLTKLAEFTKLPESAVPVACMKASVDGSSLQMTLLECVQLFV